MSSVQLPPLHAMQEVPPSQHTLLQVENNPADASLVRTLLALRSDIKLLTAFNGPQGFDMACSHLPDVILLDIRMPGMDGHDTFKLLQKNPATVHIPVIALSANAYQDDVKRCLEAGFFRYVTKPFDIYEFMAVIDDALHYAVESSPTKQS